MFSGIRAKMLARTNMFYMDHISPAKIWGQHDLGNSGKNVGADQHGLHGPYELGENFGANMFLENLGKNVGACQHRLHGPGELSETFLRPTFFSRIWAKMLARANIVYMDRVS